MPVKNKIHQMFAPCKYLCVHHSKKACYDRSYPKGNGLKQIMLKLFIPDIVERIFEGSFYEGKNFQHLQVLRDEITVNFGNYISFKNFEVISAFSTVRISGIPKLKMLFLTSSLKPSSEKLFIVSFLFWVKKLMVLNESLPTT